MIGNHARMDLDGCHVGVWLKGSFTRSWSKYIFLISDRAELSNKHDADIASSSFAIYNRPADILSIIVFIDS